MAVTALCVLAIPAVGGAEPPSSRTSPDALRAQNEALASQERSAVLGLYALDSQLARARARLAGLERQAATLRREQATLAVEMKIALAGARVSQQRLGSRLRSLFEHGDTSTLEILFGAKSLDQALAELDGLQHVTAINEQVLTQLHDAKTRIGTSSRGLHSRAARLAAATRLQAHTTRALEAALAARSSYVAGLRRQRDLNARQIVRIQEQAAAAQVRSQQVAAAPAPTPTLIPAGAPVTAAPVTAAPATVHGHTLTVSATAYALPGRTASGLPVGWGVVAVDPSVIPLGTHMTIPGYGEAVAADTGSAVKGATIDIWFPTLELARAWGRRSITITLD
jgi:3D (Asp-Asp-Asp) domain-containing protein